uniref:Uncharacterized protein n=1 Tax=Anguilla anguilla TaxID=7936 RepID=A0A0E9SIL2_ANGAN
MESVLNLKKNGCRLYYGFLCAVHCGSLLSFECSEQGSNVGICVLKRAT